MTAQMATRLTLRTFKHKKRKVTIISKEERKALADLKKDQNILILPSDKGRCTVVVDKISYEAKVNNLLSDTSTYTKLKKDPTKKY